MASSLAASDVAMAEVKANLRAASEEKSQLLDQLQRAARTAEELHKSHGDRHEAFAADAAAAAAAASDKINALTEELQRSVSQSVSQSVIIIV